MCEKSYCVTIHRGSAARVDFVMAQTRVNQTSLSNRGSVTFYTTVG